VSTSAQPVQGQAVPQRHWAAIDPTAAFALTIAVLLPYLRIALVILASVAAVLNQTTFGSWGVSTPWLIIFAVLFPVLACFGIVPLVGAAFQAFLAKTFPAAWLVTLHSMITALVVAGQEVLLTDHGIDKVGHAIIAGAITVILGLGFGSAGTALARVSAR
jgi:hypothetical protein